MGQPRDRPVAWANDPRLARFFAELTAEDDCSAITLDNDAPAVFPSGCGPGIETDVIFTVTDDVEQIIALVKAHNTAD